MRKAFTFGLLLAGLSACESGDESVLPDDANTSTQLSGLSQQEQRRFLDGLREFSEVEAAATGLGPFFNGASCAHCHMAGGVGGSGTFRVLRASCKESGKVLAPTSGTLIHLFVTRPDIVSPGVPWDCDPVVTQRRTTTVRGAGLLEAVSDADIEAVARRQPESSRGRVAYIEDIVSHKRRVGRLGWKNQHASLDAFAADAYRNELGITNQFFPDEVAPNGNVRLLALMDPTPDPEAADSAVGLLADFMRFSATPHVPDVESEGYALFVQVGCESCHTTSYETGPAPGSLAGRKVMAFSDLLLHDVGTGLDVEQGAASANEFRTAPLWGLDESSLFLHDGRAATIDEAIVAHKREAEDAAQAYLALSPEDRRAIVSFLRGR